MKKESGIKSFIKDILAIVVLAALIFGGYQGYKAYKTNQAQSDESYKVVTKRNNKYNGVYTLTKLDENGKNTWDGLIMYVKNDKIVSCSNFLFTPMSEIRQQVKENIGEEEYNKKYKNVKDNDLYEALFMNNDNDKYETPRSIREILDTGFCTAQDIGTGGILTPIGEFVCKDKVDFNKVTDIKTDYDYMVSCDIVPGYDEESQEVWLSKLLKNEKSIYSEGYKLIHYSDYWDMDKNCKLNYGDCLTSLNELFNAGLDDCSVD